MLSRSILIGLFLCGVKKWNKQSSNRSNRAITSSEKLMPKPYTSRVLMTVQPNLFHVLMQTTLTGKFLSNLTNPFLLVLFIDWGLQRNEIIIEHDDGTYTRKWMCACHLHIEARSNEGGHDIECECGRWFNCFGQQLNDPANWNDDY